MSVQRLEGDAVVACGYLHELIRFPDLQMLIFLSALQQQSEELFIRHNYIGMAFVKFRGCSGAGTRSRDSDTISSGPHSRSRDPDSRSCDPDTRSIQVLVPAE
ncbi:hypothetical protein RRG08_016281 [Elysia crispata]|uniref:Uncharacterized protein n=1 Tax=Elysia crispata TaxID=231223 RepID=A0AAE1EA92_9GAST|nr:hypothetical protein RRG08_016281 [Elysia crispata]